MGGTGMGKTGSCSVSRVLLSKALIQLSPDGWGCTPSLVRVQVKTKFLSLDMGYLYLEGSSILLSMVAQQLVAIFCSHRRMCTHMVLLCHLEPELKGDTDHNILRHCKFWMFDIFIFNLKINNIKKSMSFLYAFFNQLNFTIEKIIFAYQISRNKLNLKVQGYLRRNHKALLKRA